MHVICFLGCIFMMSSILRENSTIYIILIYKNSSSYEEKIIYAINLRICMCWCEG